jgi:hypothetical protein
MVRLRPLWATRVVSAGSRSRAGYVTGAFGKWHLGLGWRHTDGSVWDVFVAGAPLHGDIDRSSPATADQDCPAIVAPIGGNRVVRDGSATKAQVVGGD